MLEALLILSIVYACLYMPLRGKTFDALTLSQKKRVEKNFARYMKTPKAKKNPGLQIEEYLPVLQKTALSYLIMAIVILPIYIFFVAMFYGNAFANLM